MVVLEVVGRRIEVGGKGTRNGLGSYEDDEGVVRGEKTDLLEIPVFVRLEYEVDPVGAEAGFDGKEKREKRELSYWTVLGVGRIVTA